MKKIGFLFLVFGLILFGSQPASALNLVLNPGFELGTAGDADNWNENGDVRRVSSPANYIHTGSYSMFYDNYPGGSSGTTGGSSTQTISITSAGTYEFGFYARVGTEDPSLNWDQIQASIGSSGLGYTTVGTSPNDLSGLVGFSNFGGPLLLTNEWVLLSKEIYVPGPMDLLLNLNLQGQYSGFRTTLGADDAFVRTVPEPATMLLLGFGLLGLAGFRRKIKK